VWLAGHPGKTAKDFRREVWEWRKTEGKAKNAAERVAWERDHPGGQKIKLCKMARGG
jgi:hypothetical protein